MAARMERRTMNRQERDGEALSRAQMIERLVQIEQQQEKMDRAVAEVTADISSLEAQLNSSN